MLEDRKYGGHGATYVDGVQRHGHVDGAMEAEMVHVLIGVLEVVGDGGAVWGIVKLGASLKVAALAAAERRRRRRRRRAEGMAVREGGNWGKWEMGNGKWEFK